MDSDENRILEQHNAAIQILSSLADPHRTAILLLLTEHKQLCAKDLLAHLPISQPTLSHHMQHLIKMNVVAAKKDGRRVLYRVRKRHMKPLVTLAAHLAGDTKPEKKQEASKCEKKKNTSKTSKKDKKKKGKNK